MPSSLVHMAIGALLGAALIEDGFDRWALLAVMTAALIPDMDSFLAMMIPGAHRVFLHNLFLPAAFALLILYDTRYREESFLDRHWGVHGERIMWTCLVVFVFAGIGLDMFSSGVNAFWPVHDGFYMFNGVLVFSSTGQMDNELFDLGEAYIGSTTDYEYDTAVAPGNDSKRGGLNTQHKRRYPVFGNGMQFLLSLAAFGIVGYRLGRDRRRKNHRD